jgi:hypothetical protein
MTPEKTFILVEIHHKGQLKKQLMRDLPSRLSQAAYDLVQARGADCVNATSKQVEEPVKGNP